VDDSKTMDIWEWFEFGGLTTEQVKDIAARIIPNHREMMFADHAPDDDEWEGDHVILVTWDRADPPGYTHPWAGSNPDINPGGKSPTVHP
jgi:hypothetical protein